MGISINKEVDASLLLFQNSLKANNIVSDAFQRDILYNVIIKKNISRYVKRQNQINSLKSPFIKIRGVLQGIIGESIEEIKEEEIIDLSSLDEVHQTTRLILDRLEYLECIDYYKDAMKSNLNRVNKKWNRLNNS